MNYSIMRFPGSKAKMLPSISSYIDALLVNKKLFIDAFIGGGSITLYVANKYPELLLFANDKDYTIYSFWKIVGGSDFNKLQELLRMMAQPATIEQFYKLASAPIKTDIDAAYSAIFFNRTCFSGIVKRDINNKVISSPIGGKNQLSKYSVNCRYNYDKLKQKILLINKLLAGRFTISNLDVNDYISSLDKGSPIYLDPPYKNKGHQLYNIYMNLNEHEHLANLLQSKTNWVLQYDDCDEIRKFYSKNQIINLNARYSITGAKSNWINKNELIILP